ncbi:lipid A biosynthesis (KDO)2-(lauroyl)-lipid IVA acyltransferase 1 [Striga asiatica]|uniref:Lipid A biosynthesis (KDO)2-(Lauroyl)-lipid IVA acyltransferase 1 n=1 Tax=Striga asiatica TaxID=4170 RepID=A0A5A7Q6U7_STRAF|nr:lipid A biosynthesis (KDO)2-(lauroyl)-lipid IVA acyltransferase 1 [Striga asiatica]
MVAYENTLYPINGTELWEDNHFIPPLPPNFGRGAGRPSKARRRESDEIVRRNSGPSLRNLASTVNPTLFPPLSNHEDESMVMEEIPTQQSQTPLMATMQRSTPGPSMYEQLVRGNPVQPTRARHGVQIREPPTFTGERPIFSVEAALH